MLGKYNLHTCLPRKIASNVDYCTPASFLKQPFKDKFSITKEWSNRTALTVNDIKEFNTIPGHKSFIGNRKVDEVATAQFALEISSGDIFKYYLSQGGHRFDKTYNCKISKINMDILEFQT